MWKSQEISRVKKGFFKHTQVALAFSRGISMNLSKQALGCACKNGEKHVMATHILYKWIMQIVIGLSWTDPFMAIVHGYING